jgi:hypothetical protein
MRFLRPDVGDLCVIRHTGTSPIAYVSDDDLHSPLFESRVGDMVMVTRAIDTLLSPLAHHNLAAFLRLEERTAARRGVRVVGDGHRPLAVIMASGQHVGKVGAVPSFWLRIVQPAPLR